MSVPPSATITHVTSVHEANDVRVFRRECRAASEAGYRVFLVAPDAPSSPAHGVQFVSILRPARRLARMTLGAWRAWRAALRTNADVYHIHDPELLPGALVLAALGRRVVYDAHEDLEADLMDREYLPGGSHHVVAALLGAFELFVAREVAAVIAATTAIARRHRAAAVVVTVGNYPRVEDFGAAGTAHHADRPMHIAYTGLISRERGCIEMLDALELLRQDGVRLQLAGAFDDPRLRSEAEAHPAWDLVDFHGLLPYADLWSLLGQSRLGLVLFRPAPNHIEAQPNKLFEYMAAGIPVVASDFPLWREVVVECGAGVVVNPLDPRAIADVVRGLLMRPLEGEALGGRGIAAVRERYNWRSQATRLLACYRRVLEG